MGLRLITSPQPSSGVHLQPVATADEPVDEQTAGTEPAEPQPNQIASTGYAQLVCESESAKNRLDGAVNKVPRDLRRVLRQARS